MAFFTPSYLDTRLPGQTGLTDAYTSHLRGLIGQPNMGYDASRSTALDPLWQRRSQESDQAVNQMMAGQGVDPNSPMGASLKARERRQLGEARMGQEYTDQNTYRNWLAQSAAMTGAPYAGRQYQPSAFSQLAAPFVQGLGQALVPKVTEPAADWIAGAGGRLAGNAFNALRSAAGWAPSSSWDSTLPNIAPGIASGFGAGEQAAGALANIQPDWAQINPLGFLGGW